MEKIEIGFNLIEVISSDGVSCKITLRLNDDMQASIIHGYLSSSDNIKLIYRITRDEYFDLRIELADKNVFFESSYHLYDQLRFLALCIDTNNVTAIQVAYLSQNISQPFGAPVLLVPIQG